MAGKVAVITGAAMGLGEATARLFAESGAKVVVADLSEEKGRATVEGLRGRGLEASFVRTDVGDPESVAGMVRFAVERYGRLDVAVNNAAVTPDNRPVAELDLEEFDRVIRVDLRGVAICLKYEIRQFLEQGDGGSIVNIASVSGVRPQPNNLAYVAAKHGVIGMTKVASLEYAPKGIRVNAVGPGAIDTPMLRGALEAMGTTEEEFAPTLSLLGRFARPEEVAEASLWLASDRASYVTGELLMVDAGYTSR